MALTHYEVLRVPSDAGPDELRTAYRRRARETHPDAGGSAEDFAAVALAWKVLSSPDERAHYDAGLHGGAEWGEDVEVGVPASWFPPSAGPTPYAPAPTAGPVDPFTSPPRPLPPLHVQLQGFPQYAWSPPVWMIFALIATMLVASMSAATDDAGNPMLPLDPGTSAVVRLAALLSLTGIYRMWSASSSRSSWWVSAAASWGSLLAVAAMGVARIGVDEPATSTTSRAIGLAVTVAGVAFLVLVERTARRLRRQHLRKLAVLDRYRLSDAWNLLLRDLADVPGGRIAELRDPRTRLHNGWVLADDRWRVLAMVPPGAPEAWVETLQALGLDVVDVRRPEQQPASTPAPPA